MNPRQIAAAAGLSTYNTNKLCRRGHDGDRYTSNGMCVECLKITANIYKDARTERNTQRIEGFRAASVMLVPAMHTDLKRFGDFMRNASADQITMVMGIVNGVMDAIPNPTSSEPPRRGPVHAHIISAETIREYLAAKSWVMYEQTTDTKYVQLDEHWYPIDKVSEAISGRINFVFAGNPDPTTLPY